MTQKIIRIGSSAGVTIPKKQLDDLGLSIGDEVNIDVKPTTAKLKEFAGELDKFMDIYDQDLKNLAKR
ncbi:MAG TPA: AbrB/MazE/SpoVT family DNA-binding domain-containing protein [Candidatus Saccharimonadales bacterium]|nr:AbrB/MazE/SpoVT family DNA-binding domain-containing protein [Candidatus Saccharimonadales bacterium]